jgi:flagellin
MMAPPADRRRKGSSISRNRPKRKDRGLPLSGTDAAFRIKEDAIASILNNVSVFGASRHLGLARVGLSQTMQRLRTEQDLDQGARDEAGLSLKLGADIRVAKQGRRNANDCIGFLQLADGVLVEVTELLTRAAQLAERTKTDPIGLPYGRHLETECQSILSAIHDRFEKTLFNGAAVFTCSAGSGVRGGYSAIGLNAKMISSPGFTLELSAATQALTMPAATSTLTAEVAATLASVTSLRTSLEASLQHLTTVASALGIQVENCTAAYGQIRDTHITEEVVNLTKYQILHQSGKNAQGLTNQASPQILALLWWLQSRSA